MLRPKTKVVKDNAERWLLTYADLMNLLLILFILLYTISSVDKEKYKQVAASIRSAFTGTGKIIGEKKPGTENILPGDLGILPADNPKAKEMKKMEKFKKSAKEFLDSNNLNSSIEITIEERGVVISIKDNLLFASGSANILSRDTVIKIGKMLKLYMPYKQIHIEGHTDSDPIKTERFPDNMELSTARANSVLRILKDTAGIDPKYLSSTGYGEFRPKNPNTTSQNKAKNRRVDIVIIKDEYQITEPESINSARKTIENAASESSGKKTTAADTGSATGNHSGIYGPVKTASP